MNRLFTLAWLWLACWCGATDALSPPSGEELVLPIRFHLLQAETEPSIHTTLTKTNIERLLVKINGIWAPAGIRFEAEAILTEPVDPAKLQPVLENRPATARLLQLRPEPSRGSNVFHVYFVQTMQPNGIYFQEAIFVKQSASLRPVPGGIKEPLPRVTAHELGHALGLRHRQEVTNLMASGTSGFSLNAAEIQLARENAAKLPWVKKVPRVNPR